MSKSIGICVIGTGRAGMIHALNFADKVPFARIEAVADPSEESRLDACKVLGISKGYDDYRKALEDDRVDAVVIVTPTAFHREIAVAAAENGKHILCEKPMAMDETECDDMIRAADLAGVVLQLGFMRRFDSEYVKAKEIASSGAIGDIVMVRSNTRGPSIPMKWMYDISVSNGPLAEVNSHDIDALRWITGSEFSSVYAIGGNYRCPDAKDEFPDFYDNVVLNAEFSNGMQGMIDGAQGVSYAYDSRTEILGTRGCIFVGDVRKGGLSVCTADKNLKEELVSSWRDLFKDAYLNEDREFINCILEGNAPRAGGTDGKMAVRVVKAGNRSIREKRVVRMEGADQ
ncbi:MAG: Gfo/Idh/MocA family oxidoreductase [Eubacteriales bacterium]|nr:Gfo/Idh/MocA family oxidoreductase [Eubacteriales bacterium]